MEHLLAEKARFVGEEFLELLDDASIAKVTPKTLSPSASKAVMGCLAKLALDKLVPRPINPLSPADVGNVAHSIFETLFNEPPKKRDRNMGNKIYYSIIKREMKKPANAGYFKEHPDEVDQWKRLVSSACAGLTSIFEPEKVNVVGTELRLDGIEVGGTPMKGFIDLLTTDTDKDIDKGIGKTFYDGKTFDKSETLDTEKLPDDTPLIIWDYKTGKYQDETSRFGDKCEHDMQQRLYFAALKAKGKNPVGANLAYTKEGRVRRVDTSKEAVAQEVEQFSQNWETLNQTIKSNVYPTKASVLCGWCPYVKACPKAQASPKILYSRHSVSKGDATGKAYSRDELF